MTDYSKLITVNYSGGAGGEFFCNLLNSALNNTSFSAVGNEDNKYSFNTTVHPLPNLGFFQAPFLIYALHSDPDYRRLFELSFDGNTEVAADHSMFSNMYNLYLHVKDDSDEKVKENIVNLYRQFIPPPDSYNINFFFNIKPHTPGLTLADIYPNSKNILLSATDLKYIKIFWFLSWYKNKPNFTGYVKDISLYHKNIMSDPSNLNENVIYMDKLMFMSGHEEYVAEINTKLSSLLGKNVSLDLEAIDRYRLANQKIIRDFFSLTNRQSLTSNSLVDQIDYFMNNSAF